MYEVLTSRGLPFTIVYHYSVWKSTTLIVCATGIKLSNIVLIYGVIMDFITFLKCLFFSRHNYLLYLCNGNATWFLASRKRVLLETLFRGVLRFNEAGNKLQTYIHTYTPTCMNTYIHTSIRTYTHLHTFIMGEKYDYLELRGSDGLPDYRIINKFKKMSTETRKFR